MYLEKGSSNNCSTLVGSGKGLSPFGKVVSYGENEAASILSNRRDWPNEIDPNHVPWCLDRDRVELGGPCGELAVHLLTHITLRQL